MEDMRHLKYICGWSLSSAVQEAASGVLSVGYRIINLNRLRL
jgi:hypothetical protein